LLESGIRAEHTLQAGRWLSGNDILGKQDRRSGLPAEQTQRISHALRGDGELTDLFFGLRIRKCCIRSQNWRE
jgi:hypothetical protein